MRKPKPALSLVCEQSTLEEKCRDIGPFGVRLRSGSREETAIMDAFVCIGTMDGRPIMRKGRRYWLIIFTDYATGRPIWEASRTKPQTVVIAKDLTREGEQDVFD